MKPIKLFLPAIFILAFAIKTSAQYKEYKIGPKGDTINAVTKDGVKTGKWVIRVPELRGTPGHEEEGVYVKGQKDGYWRQYTLQGDLLAVENFKLGGKDGVQLYYSYIGDIEREESWRGYNPDSPYDTVAIYGTESNEIIDYKIVKAEPYSVKDGEWKYYEAGSGRILRTEKWERNNLVIPGGKKAATVYEKPKKEVPKTAEMLEWERKNRGKKGVVRDGRTGL